MANCITKVRSNLFSVTDLEKFTSIMKSCMAEDEITIINESTKNGTLKYGFVCRGNILGLPENYYDCKSEGDEDSDFEGNSGILYAELQKIISDGDAIIITTIGFEEMRYLIGYCAVITRNEINFLSLRSEALKLAQEMLGNPGFETIL